ncbi:MAG: prenyltransferase [Polyangiaceae bacterium]
MAFTNLDSATVLAFVKLGRPKFLVGGLLLYGLGTALAALAGAPTDWPRYVWGQAIVSTTQLMTHYANDFFDLDADRANSTPTRWSGGSRILPSGQIAPRVALTAALVLGACALLLAVLIAACVHGAPLILPLSLSIILLSWAYSAPPLRLLSRGLGELTTALVVTLLTPMLGFYLQSGAFARLPLLACLPLCGLQFGMLLTIELPDAASDAALGKRTLVVRRGAEWGARCGAGVVVVSFCVLPLFVRFGLPSPIAVAAAVLAPLGVWHASRLLRGAFRDPERFQGLALCSVVLLAGTTLAELIGALLALRLS